MSQCVPNWDLDDNSTPPPKVSLRSNSNSMDAPMLGYEVAELTWENGQLAMHGLCPPRLPAKPISPSKYTWEKPRGGGGTLESIVSQATRFPGNKTISDNVGLEELVPWSDNSKHSHGLLPRAAAASASATMSMDALVPCSNQTENLSSQAATTDLPVTGGGGLGTRLLGCSTRVGSCSGPAATTGDEGDHLRTEKRARVARAVPSREQSVSGSATNTLGRDGQHVTLDTCHKDFGYTSTSFGSHENNSTGKHKTATTTGGDNENDDSVCHSRPLQREAGDREDKKKGTGKSSASTKRSRAAAIHNQSERKRRDKINQRMRTLQKMVPNSSKTDKASMLDEVIDYLKQLQAQVQMMGRMNIQSMMLPMAMQPQLQMSMMTPMSFGMGMGLGMAVMDMSTITRPNVTSIPPVLHPTAFMPGTSWDGSAAGLQATSTTVVPDPLSAFLACQSQPMTMDAYSRMAAMYQQLQQQQQQQQQQQLNPNFKS